MGKQKTVKSGWISNLCSMMEERGLNPRSLSLRAGLNATAVRDMMEGRTKFPRYDTVEALAEALGTTPARLMGGKSTEVSKPDESDEDLNLLTEIIARLQETADEHRKVISPHSFAEMVTTIYRQMKFGNKKADGKTAIRQAASPERRVTRQRARG